MPRAAASRGPVLLFVAGLAVYAATRLYDLSGFPIFFFCDEAIQPNVAASLSRTTSATRRASSFPYFLNDQRWAMSLNVYLVAPVVAVGQSIVMVRATFAIVSLFGAASLGLALRVAGNRRLVGGAAPARRPADRLPPLRMALETTPAFFAGFLAAYLLYRLRSPRWVFLALSSARRPSTATPAARAIMLVTARFFSLVDAPYHFRQKARLWVAAVALLALLAWPFLREQRRHPGTTREQLLVLHSYWIDPCPCPASSTFGQQYLQGFDPRYWFLPSGAELIRHLDRRRPTSRRLRAAGRRRRASPASRDGADHPAIA